MIFQKSLLQEIGIYEYGLIDTKQITFSDEVRRLCEGNVCGNYGTTWACPPAIGTFDECKEKCSLPILEKECITLLYEDYKALNGNTFVDGLYKELMTLEDKNLTA